MILSSGVRGCWIGIERLDQLRVSRVDDVGVVVGTSDCVGVEKSGVCQNFFKGFSGDGEILDKIDDVLPFIGAVRGKGGFPPVIICIAADIIDQFTGDAVIGS